MFLHEIIDSIDVQRHSANAIRYGERFWTYGELIRESRALAGCFASRKLGRGDRVLILLDNSAPLVITALAASRLGTIFVPINPEIKPWLLDHILADCTPKIIVTDRRCSIIHAALLKTAKGIHLFVIEDDWDKAISDVEWSGISPAISTDPACLFYTSGTTNRPKAIVSPHNRMIFVLAAIQRRLGYEVNDVIACFLPMSFDYGFYQFLLAVNVGATLALGSPSETVTGVVRKLNDWGATVFPGTPSLTYALIQVGGRRSDRLPPIRLITNTGSRLPAKYISDLRELLPKAAIHLMFGLTECKRVSILDPTEIDIKQGSVGRPLDDTECFIIDDEGRVLAPGEIGELVVRGPHVMPGYWRAPEETAKRFRTWGPQSEIVLFSGDRMSMDADGYLYFHGRNDDIFKQRGYRVSAAEIEAAALEIVGVESAVVLKPTERRDAVLVFTGAISKEDILIGLAARLEDFRIPPILIKRTEILFTERGKMDKKVLAATIDGELFHETA